MGLHELGEQLEYVGALDKAKPIAKRVDSALGPGALKDALSGTWLGHPVHPMLIAGPIGAWVSAGVLDVIGGRKSRKAADRLIAVGVVSAVPTAASGLSDWVDTTGGAFRVGVVHAALNTVALGLFGASWVSRKRGRRFRGKVLSTLGLGAVSVSGWLGGHLSYAKGVGVDVTAFEPVAEDWTVAVDESALVDGRPVRADVSGAAVLVLKRGAGVVALSDACTHRGGPLHEGSIVDGCVQCPWHGSRFDLDTGAVTRGPASMPQRDYETRVRDGKVEVRVARRPVA